MQESSDIDAGMVPSRLGGSVVRVPTSRSGTRGAAVFRTGLGPGSGKSIPQDEDAVCYAGWPVGASVLSVQMRHDDRELPFMLIASVLPAGVDEAT